MKAALDLIAAKGPAGFTFAEAARAAGVSPAAPYRHYRDRDALMADVARHAFEVFEAKLKRAWAGGTPDPFTAFERVGRAYLAFAREGAGAIFGDVRTGLSFQAYPGCARSGRPRLRRAARCLRGVDRRRCRRASVRPS